MKNIKTIALAILVVIAVAIVACVYFSWPEDPPVYVHDVIEVKRESDYFGNSTTSGGIVNPNSGQKSEKDDEEQPVQPAPALSFNDSDLREVAGFADDVFIAKVIRMTDTRIVQGLVFTHYEVEVIDALKGDFKGFINVAQQGGVVGDEWTLYVEKVPTTEFTGKTSNKNQMIIGKTYLLSTLRNDVLKINLLLPTKVGYILLGGVGDELSAENLRNEVRLVPEVREMSEAIINEILPKHKMIRVE